MDTDSKLIPLTQGQFAIVDANDYDWLAQYNWAALKDSTTHSFYAARNKPVEGTKTYQGSRMHREILGLERGNPNKGDHINHDTLDNRRRNLRIATPEESQHNKRRYVNNTSGYKGVALDRGRWRAYINVQGKRESLGGFGSVEEAAAAYNEAALRLHGEFAYLNQIAA